MAKKEGVKKLFEELSGEERYQYTKQYIYENKSNMTTKYKDSLSPAGNIDGKLNGRGGKTFQLTNGPEINFKVNLSGSLEIDIKGDTSKLNATVNLDPDGLIEFKDGRLVSFILGKPPRIDVGTLKKLQLDLDKAANDRDAAALGTTPPGAGITANAAITPPPANAGTPSLEEIKAIFTSKKKLSEFSDKALIIAFSVKPNPKLQAYQLNIIKNVTYTASEVFDQSKPDEERLSILKELGEIPKEMMLSEKERKDLLDLCTRVSGFHLSRDILDPGKELQDFKDMRAAAITAAGTSPQPSATAAAKTGAPQPTAKPVVAAGASILAGTAGAHAAANLSSLLTGDSVRPRSAVIPPHAAATGRAATKPINSAHIAEALTRTQPTAGGIVGPVRVGDARRQGSGRTPGS